MPAADEEDEASRPGRSFNFKVVVFGSKGSGKTSLVKRFARSAFDQGYAPTTGIDFYVNQVLLPDDVRVSLQVWDVGGSSPAADAAAGDAGGSGMAASYAQGCQAALLVWDMTSTESFAALAAWHDVVAAACGRREMPYLLLVGAKQDAVTGAPAADGARTEEWLQAHELVRGACVTSAKTGAGVAEAFRTLAADLAGVPLPEEGEADGGGEQSAAAVGGGGGGGLLGVAGAGSRRGRRSAAAALSAASASRYGEAAEAAGPHEPPPPACCQCAHQGWSALVACVAAAGRRRQQRAVAPT